MIPEIIIAKYNDIYPYNFEPDSSILQPSKLEILISISFYLNKTKNLKFSDILLSFKLYIYYMTKIPLTFKKTPEPLHRIFSSWHIHFDEYNEKNINDKFTKYGCEDIFNIIDLYKPA